jgi:HAMP domain-containing protein
MLQQAAADLLALGFGVFTARAITSALSRVRRSVEGLADGDLTAATGVDKKDDVGRMAAALDSARENLRGLVASVASSADAVAPDLLFRGGLIRQRNGRQRLPDRMSTFPGVHRAVLASHSDTPFTSATRGAGGPNFLAATPVTPASTGTRCGAPRPVLTQGSPP